MKKSSEKKSPGKKTTGKPMEAKKTVSGLMADVRKEAVHVGQKGSAAASEADRKLGKAGNEMKASLQEMKKDIQQMPKSADKKKKK
ncbi:MAG: hypothetical protein AB9880_11410 [Christensenellales bacterium]